MPDLLNEARSFLQAFRDRAERRDGNRELRCSDLIDRERVAAGRAGDEARAKEAWLLGKTLEAQQQYCLSFEHTQAGRYYEAWCVLERVEIALIWLQRHTPFDAEFGLDTIAIQTPLFQKLYPYALFISPAYIEKARQCSICGRFISVRSHCGHLIGEVYAGEMCTNAVTIGEILEVSVVPNPAHKTNVMFLTDRKTGERVDQYDYSLLAYVARGLRNPYDRWAMVGTTRRHPHSRYRHVGRNALCPCESGRRYKACCLRESGVLRPHINIEFQVQPLRDFPEIAYSTEI
jgi:hypothetical protein